MGLKVKLKSCQQGFTLVELMVAVVIMSFFVTGAYAMLNQGTKVVNRELNQVNERNDVRIALIQVSKDIQESVEVRETNGSYVFTLPDGQEVSYFYDDAVKAAVRVYSGNNQTLLTEVDSFSIQTLDMELKSFSISLGFGEKVKSMVATRRSSQANEVAVNGTLMGKVIDLLNLEPIAGAKVEILEITSAHTTTDIEGAYELVGIPVGFYTVKASAVGYNDKLFEDMAILPRNYELNIVLVPIDNGGGGPGSNNCVEIANNFLRQGQNYLGDDSDGKTYLINSNFSQGNGQHLNLVNNILFIEGNYILNTGAHINGIGTIYVMGNLTLAQGSQIGSMVQVFVGGNATSHNNVQGKVYVKGNYTKRGGPANGNIVDNQEFDYPVIRNEKCPL